MAGQRSIQRLNSAPVVRFRRTKFQPRRTGSSRQRDEMI
jgi:hypothetical protein